MSGKRRPMDVNLSVVDGGKHWTKDEIASRRREELKLPKPKRLKAPKWLDPAAKKLFGDYAKLLLAFPEGIVSELDTGTLARYCDCELAYAEASAQKTAWLAQAAKLHRNSLDDGGLPALGKDDDYATAQKQVDYWSSQMARFEKICRGCAADMGLSVTSRCRLVVPQVELTPETDPLAELQRKFMGG